MQTLWLTGMMGSGKSTVGPALAERLGQPFIDTDAEIERAEGRSVAAIFAEEGEARFRELEREAIDTWAGKPVVVALGGGAIAQPGADRRLAESGTVVYLRARVATLLSRVDAGAARPLLEGLSAGEQARKLGALLEERREAYESASLLVDTDDRDAEAVADWIAGQLESESEASA